MKVHTRRGPTAEVISVTSIPEPMHVPPHHVKVKVSYAALNSSCDFVIRSIPKTFSTLKVPEWEFSGRIVEVGADVREEFRVGASVFGFLYQTKSALFTFKEMQGALAEYVVANVDFVALKPSNATEAQAAYLPIAFVGMKTLDVGRVGPGDSILVVGGSGAIGTALVQMAKHVVGKQGRVVATCSKSKMDFVEGLGADEVIDYKQDVGAYLLWQPQI